MTAIYTVRERNRRGYVREAQAHRSWTEYQVLDGRRVVRRFDVERQARDWITRQALKSAIEAMIAEERAAPKPCPDLLGHLRHLLARASGVGDLDTLRDEVAALLSPEP